MSNQNRRYKESAFKYSFLLDRSNTKGINYTFTIPSPKWKVVEW